MKLLEGKPIAEEMLSRVKAGVANMDCMPGFGAILVGEDPASRMYVNIKKKMAQECGMLFCDYALPHNATNEQVLEVVEFLNRDSAIYGILVQLPLPEHIDRERIINAIDPRKDVDGLTRANQTCLREDGNCFVCPFPKAILSLLKQAGASLSGKTAAVCVNSKGFGSTMVSMLALEGVHAEYILSPENSEEKKKMSRADIVITATGKAGSIESQMVKDGAILIDGGIEKTEDVVRGDVDAASFADRDVTLTPVPGGVGPVTVACLIENVYLAAKRMV